MENVERSILGEEKKKIRRKRRTDRNQVIYKLTCIPTGETYIGVTVAHGRAYKKSVRIRWVKHLYHACIENRMGLLQIAIREHGQEAFSHEILHVIRGKSAAHKMELDLIHKFHPPLNVEGVPGRKKKKKKNKKRKNSLN